LFPDVAFEPVELILIVQRDAQKRGYENADTTEGGKNRSMDLSFRGNKQPYKKQGNSRQHSDDRQNIDDDLFDGQFVEFFFQVFHRLALGCFTMQKSLISRALRRTKEKRPFRNDRPLFINEVEKQPYFTVDVIIIDSLTV
jgi:hypothetical protein